MEESTSGSASVCTEKFVREREAGRALAGEASTATFCAIITNGIV